MLPIKRTVNCLCQHLLSFLLLLLARLEALSHVPAASRWGHLPRMASSSSEPIAARRDFVYTHSGRLDAVAKLPGVAAADFKQIDTERTRIKVYCISDLHADTNSNQEWVRARCVRSPEDADVFTVIMVAGDVGSEFDRVDSIMDVLAANYDAVCFVVGNHEVWRRGAAAGGSATVPETVSYENRMAPDSVEKLKEVMASAGRRGVHTGPVRVSGSGGRSVVVLPLYSWYHGSWDTEPDITHASFLEVEEAVPFHLRWGDFSMCSWPGSLLKHEDFASIRRDAAASTALADAFGSLNERFLLPCSREGAGAPSSSGHCSPLVQLGDAVLSFSHFLPRTELCPEKRYLLEPFLFRVSGSDVLREQIERLAPHVHCFGHTHIPLDLTLGGTRYIQWPLGYSKEADKQCAPVRAEGPLLVCDTQLGVGGDGVPVELPSLRAAWTDYYASNDRRPHITEELSPWLQRRLDTFAGLVRSNRRRKSAGEGAATGGGADKLV